MGDIDEKEISLRDILKIIRKRFWIIFLITFIVTISSGLINYFVLTPIYEGSTELLVNRSEGGQSSMYNLNDINIELKLIDTYRVIMESPRIIDLVIDKYNLSLTREELIGKINISTVKNSRVMKITVLDPNQREAVRIANGIAKTFQQEIVKIMNVDNVQILTEAKVIQDLNPTKPRKLFNTVLSFFIGLTGSFGLAFLLDYLDNTIKNEEDIEQILGYPVLGSVATINIRK